MAIDFWKPVAWLLARPAVTNWLIRRAQRTPYTHIVTEGKLYMERYWLFNPYPQTGGSGADRPRWQFPISIRLHHIVLPDQDRGHMHDHPWNARTFILRGGYTEMRPKSAVPDDAPGVHDLRTGMLYLTREPGETASLAFGEYHRIVSVAEGGAWTLFVTGKYRGTWGFLVDGKKIPWREYLGIEK